MHASKDSMWREILKKFCKILGTKQALSLSRQGMAMAVFTSLCSSQSFHSHSRSPTRYSSLSFGNSADVVVVETSAAKVDDAMNWGPTRLMAGASMMFSNDRFMIQFSLTNPHTKRRMEIRSSHSLNFLDSQKQKSGAEIKLIGEIP